MWVKVTLTSSQLRSPFWLRNFFRSSLIMDDWVIFRALMRTLNHVLSLSFERCENDITAIVFRKWNVYILSFFYCSPIKILKKNFSQFIFLFGTVDIKVHTIIHEGQLFFLLWWSSARRVICLRGVLTPAAFRNEGQFWRPPVFCYYI